jgi:predicted MFS family arabinose efflux permease
MSAADAKQEWARAWPLPFVGMLGVAGSAIFPYSSGVFLSPMVEEFGWGRADFYSAFMLQTILGLVITPIVGRLVDHFGPRTIALIGIPIFAATFASLGLATSSLDMWRLHFLLLGVSTAIIQPLVWVTAVVGRFHAARGLAMAVALAGVGVASTISPLAATFYLQEFGWRGAYAALGLSWGLPVLLLSVFWFRGLRREATAPAQQDVDGEVKRAYWRALKSPTLLCLILAGGIFTTIAYGLTMHLIPILKSGGLDDMSAASIAALAGVSAIIGRLVAGYLLDHFPARRIGVCLMLLPIVASAMLLLDTSSPVPAIVAVAFLGFATGGETDVLAYMISREFDQRIFATIYAFMAAILSLGASFGPMMAGAAFDANGAYTVFLYSVSPMVVVAALLLGLAPRAVVAAPKQAAIG